MTLTMGNQTQFPLLLNLKSPKYLKLRLNTSIEELRYFCENKEKLVYELSLKTFKNGNCKERTVYNPSPRYKDLLRKINRAFLSKARFPIGVLGGVIGGSIDKLAEMHCEQDAVLCIDLKSFFPSIGSGKVHKFFRRTGCTSEVCDILTDIVTLRKSLPQGFPTSPMLANLVAFDLDCQQLAQSDKTRIKRTRWIDDIAFSGKTSDLKKHAPSLIDAVKYHGFKINNEKTCFNVRSNKPVVVGLDVSGHEPMLPQVTVDKLKDILLTCQHSGWQLAQSNYECDVFGRQKRLQLSLEGKLMRVEKYKHKEAKEMRGIYNSIDWNN